MEVLLFMRMQPTAPAIPAGLAFEVADLILLQSWAEFHDMRMAIELDHCDADGEYEEMVVIYAKESHEVRWLIWRSGEIIVQPLIGRSIHCPSVADAVERLSLQL
jgi:hypothetical protein